MNQAITTDQRILNAAQQLLQTRGYNGFSYKDIAADVNIKTSSIHYHFSTKQILVEQLFDRYMTQFFALLDDISRREGSSLGRLKALCDIFEQSASSRKFCMCGSLAVVHYAIPEGVNVKVSLFAEKSKAWIQQVLEQGVQSGEIKLRTSASAHATVLFSALEGALMLSQTRQDGVEEFKATTAGLLAVTGG